jgi:hypothetical protein
MRFINFISLKGQIPLFYPHPDPLPSREREMKEKFFKAGF